MARFVKGIVLLIVLALNTSLFAKERDQALTDEVFGGPEIYYVKRTKEGGGEQTGTLCGARIGYEHIKYFHLYWGCDFLWATGSLEGRVHKAKVKSRLTDTNIEARVGFTFFNRGWKKALFIPYVGIGYFEERNFYHHPSPLPVHFDNQFNYIPFGFLSEVFITSACSVGLNIKVRYLLDGSQKVSHDPDHESVIQYYNERLQYRLELPITYFFCWRTLTGALVVDPFYEYRAYGHRANYPFDFYDTKFQLYGATFKVCYLF